MLSKSKSRRKSIFLVLSLSVLLALLLSACGAHVYHQVRKGDTLYSISWHYSQDYRQVAKWNGMNSPYMLSEGQWLRVAPPGPDAGLEPPVYLKKPAKAQTANADETNPKKLGGKI